MQQLSIRWRLTLWYGGILAIVLIAFGTAVFLMLRHHMLETIDTGLDEELADVLTEVHRADTRDEMLRWLNRRFANHEGFDFQVVTTSGERIFANPRLGDQSIPLPEFRAGGSQDVYHNEPMDDQGRWRVISRRTDGPDGGLIIQVARSLNSFDHEVGEVLAALLVAGPLAWLAALSGGYFLAGRALSPVDRMTRTAGRITARRLDERLEITNSGDELGRLAQTLNDMIERLERTFREMQRFTADASHELRTPIAVIRTEVEVSLGKTLSAAETQNLMSNILEECERLTWITEQLLILTREDAGIQHTVREPVELDELVRNASETMRPLAAAKEQRLRILDNGPVRVSGDPTRLRQVVYNVLDNAIKYTPSGGRIDVTLAVDDRTAVTQIQDTGIGIAAEHLPQIFDRFYRVDKARSRAQGGSGLGLSIVQSIVTAHGGNVEIQSTPGHGTTCTILLPLISNNSEPTSTRESDP